MVTHVWRHDCDLSGFSTTTETIKTTNLSASYALNKIGLEHHTVPKEFIEAELANLLASELLKSKALTYYKHFDQTTLIETIVSTVTVCPPNIKFRSVESDVFVLNGEHFKEDEIIFALKQTFPDRII